MPPEPRARSRRIRTAALARVEAPTATLTMPDDELQWQCEQTIRNRDPRSSCPTHVLKLDQVRA